MGKYYSLEQIRKQTAEMMHDLEGIKGRLTVDVVRDPQHLRQLLSAVLSYQRLALELMNALAGKTEPSCA